MDDLDLMDDDEEVSVQYSSEENSEPDVDLENKYYEAKGCKETNPIQALEFFASVLTLEQIKGDWGFKALKQMVKLNFKLNRIEEMMSNYRQFLTYIRCASVTRNYSEKSINSILDFVSSSSHDLDLLQRFYTTTLEALRDAKNERLWFKTSAKLGRLYLEQQQWPALHRIIRELHASCQRKDGGGEDHTKKGTQLLEIYALEIQMYTQQKNHKRLKALYNASLAIKSAIPHPLIIGIIRECGGKMHLQAGEFEAAYEDFFDAFKNFDESGSERRIQCLKYLVLANMLQRSQINPFESQETKPYKQDAEIAVMTSLVAAYQANDIAEFERILAAQHDRIMEDAFIKEHVDDLLRNIRTGLLVRLVRPYRRIRLAYLARRLSLAESQVERLLVWAIADGAIPNGRIDQAEGVLVMTSPVANPASNTAVSTTPPGGSEGGSVYAMKLHHHSQSHSQSLASQSLLPLPADDVSNAQKFHLNLEKLMANLESFEQRIGNSRNSGDVLCC